MADDQPTPSSSTLTLPPDAPPSASLVSAPPQASLYVLQRDGAAFEYELVKPETLIGKSGQNEVVLSDASVSSTHAQITVADNRFTLTDLGSRNGTLLNDAKVTEPQPLHHGDLIKMGHCTLTFRLEEAGSTLSMGRTELLGALTPPPAPAPPAPKPAAITEEVLANALASSGLVAQAELDRVRAEKPAEQRLAQALLEKKLVTEIGLRDLMSRTFNLAPVDVKTMEIDAATAVSVGAELLRQQAIFPTVSQQSDKLLLVVADPTKRSAIEEIERKMRRRAALKLALPGEIAAQLDAFFLPRLIGVLPTGEKLEALINQAEIEIGKAAHNRVVINDPTVSSTHAILLARDGGYNIADMGSSNGTFVNGAKLNNEACTLQHGDKIQLGQVVLTFRNPAETTENKTARLSLDELEKARQRAMTRSLQTPLSAKTDPNTWEQQAAPVAPAPDEQAAEEEREKKEKKKREKEKKEGDRLRAAWVGGISRIVAQVLGVLLTVGLTLYLIRPGGGGGGGGGGSSNQQSIPSLKHAALRPVKTWAAVSTGLFGSKIEPSGVAYVPNSNGVLIVSDNRESEIAWMQLDEKGQQVGGIKYIQLGIRVRDPESITYGNGYFYIASSQVNPKDAEANTLVRFDFDAATQTLRGAPEVIPDLRKFLLDNVSEIASLGAPSGVDGGLNIEGIAWDPNNERLLLGLRSPQIGTQAVIIPLKLRDPRGPFKLENLRLDEPHVIVLSLDGQGVRDITYDPRIKNFLLISGAPETSPKTDFGLWEWSGQSDAKPEKLMVLDDKQKPEGVTSASIGGAPFVFVVGDAGGHTKIDYAEIP